MAPGGAALSDVATADLLRPGPPPVLRGLRPRQRRGQPAHRAEGRARRVRPPEGGEPDDVEILDAALGHFAAVLEKSIGSRATEYAAAPGAGAAGGIGYGALVLGARFRPVSR